MQQHVYAISQACHQFGVKHVFICPGSRSAPLVYAFSASNKFSLHSVVDERSAGYSAIGVAQQLQQPVVLICTSGTAALNFYPAIAEAFFQHIPLLVLTADRPPELLFQQDGQMINQHQVFENHVLASFTLPCYSQGKENLLETFDITESALQLSSGLRKGPVHINVPLSEPLYPKSIKAPAIAYRVKEKQLYEKVGNSTLQKAWEESKKRIIIIGQQPINPNISTQLLRLKNEGKTIIISDILSNQFTFGSVFHSDTLLGRADEKTREAIEPDFILSFGGQVLSKHLKQWLKTIRPRHHFRINKPGERIDTYANVTTHLIGEESVYLATLSGNSSDPDLFKQFWHAADMLVSNSVNTYLKKNVWSEPHAINQLLKSLPDACNIHLANSGVIRLVNMGGYLHPSWILNGNRGTSGIDGCTSTALGAAMVNNRETFLLTGDLSFLYDINALWRNQLPKNFKIVVLNNHKGQIFEWIDGPSNHKKQLPLFTTPHNRDIAGVCKAFGIKHIQADSNKSFLKRLPLFLQDVEPTVLELSFSTNQNMKWLKAFKTIPL